MNFEEHMQNLKATREADAKRFVESDGDLCMVCGAYGADKRSVIIETGYQMKEITERFIDLHLVEGRLNERGFYLRICKMCRGELLGALRSWFESRRDLSERYQLNHDGYIEDEEWRDDARNIPVRIDGRTVMMNPEEYERYEKKNGGGSI